MPDKKKLIEQIVAADKELIEKFGADVFDDLDCRPGNAYPEADRNDVIPEHIKIALEEKRKAKK